MDQETYNAIATYVANGHALHPEYAAKLLDAFEERHRMLDRLCAEDTRPDAPVFELLCDAEGDPRLVLR